MRHALAPLVLALLGSASAAAQAPVPAARAPAAGRAGAAQGQLSAEELERAFREADLDRDGKLDRAEFARALQAHEGRRAQAADTRLARRIGDARREVGAGQAGDGLGQRLAEALERAEPRLLGAGSREAFAELRREAIGLARQHAAAPGASERSQRFLEALAALESKAGRGELSRQDLLALRNDLRREAESAGAESRATKEEGEGPAEARRRAQAPAAERADARPPARAAGNGRR